MVTPQLFAQLCHPSDGVRRVVQELLQSLGAVSPAAVLYPALVELRSQSDGGSSLSLSTSLESFKQSLFLHSYLPTLHRLVPAVHGQPAEWNLEATYSTIVHVLSLSYP